MSAALIGAPVERYGVTGIGEGTASDDLGAKRRPDAVTQHPALTAPSTETIMAQTALRRPTRHRLVQRAITLLQLDHRAAIED